MTTSTARNRKKPGKGTARRLRIETDLTIYTALRTKDLLLAELAAGPELAIDLSAVSEIDTAGLQLLLLAGREAAKAGKKLELVSPSTAVTSVLELCNMGSLLDTTVQSTTTRTSE